MDKRRSKKHDTPGTTASGVKTDRFGKIYREFTRVKFRKYKLQFPRLRESEIVNKIIREWEAMDEEAKDNLERQFIERSGHGFLEEESSSSKKRREQAEKAAARAVARQKSKSQPSKSGKKKKKPSPKVRVFEEKPPTPGGPKDDSDFKRSQQGIKSGKKSTPDKSSDSHLPDKTKFIKKPTKEARRQEYLTFFKYYYEKLASEHPRWNKTQTVTIIRLLWKKRLRANQKRQGSKRVLSGRQLYRKQKEAQGFMREQIKQMWKALPHESKKYWQIKGHGRPILSKRNSGRYVRRVLNSGGSRSDEQSKLTMDTGNFGWMQNPMR